MFAKAFLAVFIIYQCQAKSISMFTFNPNCDGIDGLSGTITVSPEPIKLNANFTIDIDLETKVTLASPLKLVTTLSKYVNGAWEPQACTGGIIGDCTVDDICTLISKIPILSPCPIAPLKIGPIWAQFPLNIAALQTGQFKGNVKIYSNDVEKICGSIAFTVV